MNKSNGLIWSRPDWLERAERWILDVLGRQAMAMTGPIEQPHVRAWGTVLRVPTEGGDLYFKASAPVAAFEAALAEALYRWRPDCTLEVLEADPERGWFLMVDGGRRARESAGEAGGVRMWEEILPLYAELQIDLAGRADELLGMGVPDLRLALLPDKYGELLADKRWLRIGRPDGLSSAEYESLVQYAPTVEEMCRRLDSFGVPPSLHHGDLHDGNIFFDKGCYVFFDWGDSSISHPFFSLRTVFVSIENSFGLEEDDPLFEELSRVYLSSWRDYGSAGDLAAAFEIGRRLWSLASAIKYWSFLRQVEGMNEEFGHAVPGLLQEFLEGMGTR